MRSLEDDLLIDVSILVVLLVLQDAAAEVVQRFSHSLLVCAAELVRLLELRHEVDSLEVSEQLGKVLRSAVRDRPLVERGIKHWFLGLAILFLSRRLLFLFNDFVAILIVLLWLFLDGWWLRELLPGIVFKTL